MKHAVILTVCFLLLCVEGAAQDEAEFAELMNSASQSVGRFVLNVQAKDGDAAVSDANRLGEIFGRIYEFFEEKNVGGAMKFAQDAQAGFKMAGELASAGKLEEAYAKLQATRANCNGCHNSFRGKNADGSYTIKY